MTEAGQLPVPLRALSSVGRLPLPREVRFRERRTRVVAGAVGLFAERGYAGVRIEDLAAAGSVSIGGFYQLFDDKSDCLLFAHNQVLGQLREVIAAALEEEAQWPGQAEAALQALVAFCAAEPEAARLLLLVIEAGSAQGRAAHRAALREAEELLRAARGRTSGAAAPPPAYEEFAIAATAWRLRRAIEGGEGLESPELYGELRALLLGPHLS